MAEARPNLNIPLQTELNRKFMKNYPIQMFDFKPNCKSRPVTGKFYSKWDHSEALDSCEDETSKPAKVFKESKKIETSSQEYGLYPEPLEPVDHSDRRLYKGRIECDITRIEIAIRQANVQL